MRALFTLTRRLWRARGVLVMVLFRAKSSVRTESQRALLRLSDWPVDSNDCRAISISNWTKCTADKSKAQFKLAATHVGRYVYARATLHQATVLPQPSPSLISCPLTMEIVAS